MNKVHTTHALSRTSPKGVGQIFIGTCYKCGMENLPAEAVKWPCSNVANITPLEELKIATEGLGEG